jgi:ABC-type amino acid transport substrate-binding protein
VDTSVCLYYIINYTGNEMRSTIIAKKLLLLIILLFTISFVYAEKKITVVTDDNYPPYIFRDKDGNLQGILVDQWICGAAAPELKFI